MTVQSAPVEGRQQYVARAADTDLFDVSSLVIDKNPDVTDPRSFVQGL